MTDEDLIKRLAKEKNELIEDNLKLIKLYLKSQEEKRQLETIIDEVIELINKDRNKEYGSLEKKSFYCSKTNKLLEILERR